MSLTEDVTIKPLVICGGCSFTHSPDSWANVLGNYREIHNGFARKFFEVWRDAGIKETGADPSIFPDSVYDYWEDGEDLTDYIEVLNVAQGAAGQELNSRIIRNAITDVLQENPDRQILVFWQLSGWDRIEMLTNSWANTWHDSLYKHDRHMTSVIRPWLNNVTEPDVMGRVDSTERMLTPTVFTPKERYWWKSGGAVPEQWLDSALENYTKHYYEDVWSSEYSSLKNLELIEYTRNFCDNRSIPLIIFPGWSGTWNRAVCLSEIDTQFSAFEMLDRLPEDIVTDIDGYGGIAEWGTQYQLYFMDKYKDHCYDSVATEELNFRHNEGGSNYEKYYEDGKYLAGNHPSCHIHALFCNQWIKPRVKEFLESVN